MVFAHFNKQLLGFAEEAGAGEGVDDGVEGDEVEGRGGAEEAGGDGDGLGVVVELEGKLNEGGMEDEVGRDTISVHPTEPEEGGVEEAGAGEVGDEGRIGDAIGGERMVGSHLENEARGKRPLPGAEGVAKCDIVGEDGRGVAGRAKHPIEESDGAAPIRLA